MNIYKNAQKAFLLTEDGHLFEGYSVGAKGDAYGELVFNTAVVGYQQLLTDPANENNILISTFPMLGNYGVVEGEDDLSPACASAVIMREWCDTPSNYRCTGRFDEWLERKGIVGLFGVDTRALTRKLRDHGVVKALVTTNPITEENKAEKIESIKAYQGKTPYGKHNTETKTVGNGQTRVTVVDFGVRADVIQALCDRDCTVTIVPASATEKQIRETNPDGVVLCGGWADFAQVEGELETVRALEMAKIPMLGIGVGHQLMAMSAGGKMKKMQAGHRGVNCPVTEVSTGRTFITTQNHGWFVEGAYPNKAEVTHVNSNDKSCEGMRYLEYPGMSVQFIPEGEQGNKNFDGIYEAFLKLMNK